MRDLNAHEDLLAACKALPAEVAHCAVVGDPMYAAVNRDYRRKLSAVAEQARAIIAKAEGEGT